MSKNPYGCDVVKGTMFLIIVVISFSISCLTAILYPMLEVPAPFIIKLTFRMGCDQHFLHVLFNA